MRTRAAFAAVTLLASILAMEADAYKPASWAYLSWPYMYDNTYTEWVYLNELDSQWVINLQTQQWALFGNSLLKQGWSYWTSYPYVYGKESESWFWFPASAQWCRNMYTGQWSLLGVAQVHNGEIQFTLTWDRPVDLDLHVMVRGEELHFDHRVGTAGAEGGILDVDDLDGYGPENVYWAAGKAPQPAAGQYIIFQPSVHYFSGSGVVNYTLEYKVTGDGRLSTGGGLPYTYHGRFEDNEVGRTQSPYSMHYYGR